MKYRDKFYEKYVSTHTHHQYGDIDIAHITRQFPVWKRYFSKHLPREENAHILDIGCGFGGFVYFLQKLGYKNSHGVDVSGEQIELGVKMGVKNILQEDVFKFLEGKKYQFDVIFARDFIEHFSKDEVYDLLVRLHESLRYRGTLIIQTPNGESPFSGRLLYGDITHEIIFTRISLHQILALAGFAEASFHPTGPVPKGFKSVVRYLLWKIIESLLKFYSLIETGSSAGIFTQNVIAVAKKIH